MLIHADVRAVEQTVISLLSRGAARLETAAVETPRLEAELLLAHVLGLSRTQLLASSDQTLSSEQAQMFERLLARRLTREPLPYILGHWEFYGLDFRVDARGLIPRPETEHMVEQAIARARALPIPKPGICDVGTGSGCVAIALALHLPQVRLYATDLSTEALALAKENAAHLGVLSRIHFLQGDLLQPLPNPVHLIVANLPYIAHDEWETLAPEVGRYEPRLALDGGSDGLDLIRQLLIQSVTRLHPHGIVLLEVGAAQAEAVRRLALSTFPHARTEFIHDYAGHARIVEVCL